jgi:lipoate-protein ligase A
MLEVVNDTKGSAHHHMEVDRALIVEGNACPRLRLYEWDGLSITVGIFLDPAPLLHLEQCRRMNIEIVKRPTGGGLLFHGSDLALSLFVPGQPLGESVEEWCCRVNECLLRAIRPYLPPEGGGDCELSKERCRFCMSQVTAFDLVWGGRKIGGCAQRKTRVGILHQASLFLTSPNWERIALCIRNVDDVRRMQQVATPLDRLTDLQICREELQDAIINSFLDWNIQ